MEEGVERRGRTLTDVTDYADTLRVERVVLRVSLDSGTDRIVDDVTV